MTDIQLVRAVLIPMNGDQPDQDQTQYIPVQFNPNSLRISLSNTAVAPNAGRGSTASTQYVDRSESSLSVQLIFDTSVPGVVSNMVLYTDNQNLTGSQSVSTSGTTNNGSIINATNHQANYDVRKLTQAIVEKFMKPDESQHNRQNKPAAPKKCRFQWGSFVFVGMVNSYSETLDFFTPEGVPLRSTLALSLKEDKYQYLNGAFTAGARDQPQFAPAAPEKGLTDAAGTNGQDQKNWRDIALFNGIENARAIGLQGLSIPSMDLSEMSSRVGSPEVGFDVGISASLGSSIPGAFQWK